MDALLNPGRSLLVALALIALLVVPTAAFAQNTGGAPLSEVPREYEPALRAAAAQLGLSYDELRTASADELQRTLCRALEGTTTAQVAAEARTALGQASDVQLAALSPAERRRLEANLPAIIAQVKDEYCATSTASDGTAPSEDSTPADDAATSTDQTGSGNGDSTTGGAPTTDGETPTTVDSIPVPKRVDTGGGGADGDHALPVAFGTLFATLFGGVGVAVTARRRTT